MKDLKSLPKSDSRKGVMDPSVEAYKKILDLADAYGIRPGLVANLFIVTLPTIYNDRKRLRDGSVPPRPFSILSKMQTLLRIAKEDPSFAETFIDQRMAEASSEEKKQCQDFFREVRSVLSDYEKNLSGKEGAIGRAAPLREDLSRLRERTLGIRKRTVNILTRIPRDIFDKVREEAERSQRSFADIIEDSILSSLPSIEKMKNAEEKTLTLRIGKRGKELKTFHFFMQEPTVRRVERSVPKFQRNAFIVFGLKKRYGLDHPGHFNFPSSSTIKKVAPTDLIALFKTHRSKSDENLVKMTFLVDRTVGEAASKIAVDLFGTRYSLSVLFSEAAFEFFRKDRWDETLSSIAGSETSKKTSEKPKTMIVHMREDVFRVFEEYALFRNVSKSLLAQEIFRWYVQRF